MPQVSCAVYKCTNNSKKLRKIKAEICSKHKKTKGRWLSYNLCYMELPNTTNGLYQHMYRQVFE